MQNVLLHYLLSNFGQHKINRRYRTGFMVFYRGGVIGVRDYNVRSVGRRCSDKSLMAMYTDNVCERELNINERRFD